MGCVADNGKAVAVTAIGGKVAARQFDKIKVQMGLGQIGGKLTEVGDLHGGLTR